MKWLGEDLGLPDAEVLGGSIPSVTVPFQWYLVSFPHQVLGMDTFEPTPVDKTVVPASLEVLGSQEKTRNQETDENFLYW